MFSTVLSDHRGVAANGPSVRELLDGVEAESMYPEMMKQLKVVLVVCVAALIGVFVVASVRGV